MGMNTAALTLGQASVWRAASWVPRMRSHGFACGRYKDYLTPTSNALWYCRAWKVWATWYLSVYLLLKSIRRRRTQDRFSIIFGFTFSTLSYNGTLDPLGNGTMPTLSPRVSERCRITSYRKKTFSYLKPTGKRDFFSWNTAFFLPCSKENYWDSSCPIFDFERKRKKKHWWSKQLRVYL